MDLLKKIVKVLINKYVVITLAFILWMVFFDSNNFFTRSKLRDKLEDLHAHAVSDLCAMKRGTGKEDGRRKETILLGRGPLPSGLGRLRHSPLLH